MRDAGVKGAHQRVGTSTLKGIGYGWCCTLQQTLAAAPATSSSGAKLWTGEAPYFPSNPEEQLQSLDVRLQVEDQEILQTCSDSPIL
ncbi:hypothetical protein PEBR_04177 [Penicillium brasilianum]|uniref:Uncharacterized protein n=1 Tax=Penicillium brasilianum TaxID=104259 RepID=A0A1S9RYY2_PENBI|nr:hypothetical protein PEBR_04177 [Penicillium brasilianum]